MTSASSLASCGSLSSPSSSPSASACSPRPFASSATLSLVAAQAEAPRGVAVAELVDELHAFENLLRDSYAAGARVSAAFAAAQKAEKLSPVAGHQFVAAISNAGVQACGALSATADAHRLLEKLGMRLGFDVAAYGDGQKDPKEEIFTSGALRASHAA